MTLEPLKKQGPRGDWREGLPFGSLVIGQLPDISAVEFDSRAVKPGDLFVCIVGERSDGHEFAADAVRAGAAAVVAEIGMGGGLEGLRAPLVWVPDSRRALSSIA